MIEDLLIISSRELCALRGLDRTVRTSWCKFLEQMLGRSAAVLCAGCWKKSCVLREIFCNSIGLLLWILRLSWRGRGPHRPGTGTAAPPLTTPPAAAAAPRAPSARSLAARVPPGAPARPPSLPSPLAPATPSLGDQTADPAADPATPNVDDNIALPPKSHRGGAPPPYPSRWRPC